LRSLIVEMGRLLV